MKTTIFYSALVFLLIAALTVLAVATAMRPSHAVAPEAPLGVVLPEPVAPEI